MRVAADSDLALARDPAARSARLPHEVFELIRPLSEQWGMKLATVAALRTPERTGTWDVYIFRRSVSGDWSHEVQTITRNP